MPLLKIDWSTVTAADFATESDSALAARLGCSRQNVALERRRRKLAPHARGSGRTTGPHKSPVLLSRRAAGQLVTLARGMDCTESAAIGAISDGIPRLITRLADSAAATTDPAARAVFLIALTEARAAFRLPASFLPDAIAEIPKTPDSLAKSHDLSGEKIGRRQ